MPQHSDVHSPATPSRIPHHASKRMPELGIRAALLALITAQTCVLPSLNSYLATVRIEYIRLASFWKDVNCYSYWLHKIEQAFPCNECSSSNKRHSVTTVPRKHRHAWILPSSDMRRGDVYIETIHVSFREQLQGSGDNCGEGRKIRCSRE
jgi:hypothetical protein